MYADERVAWEGAVPGEPHTPLRVEAAAYRGKPVSFLMVGPWTTPSLMKREPRTGGRRLVAFAGTSIGVLLLCAAAGLARHNLRVGTRRPPRRVARVDVRPGDFDARVGARRFFVHLGSALVSAGLMWLFYVALEPYVRRYCSDIMISWTRVLNGQIRDARVGRRRPDRRGGGGSWCCS